MMTGKSDIESQQMSDHTTTDVDGVVRHERLTARALVIGAFLSLFLAVGSNYADAIIRGSYMTLDFSTPGAIFLFLILVGGLNVLFKFVGRSWWLAGIAFLTAFAAYLIDYYPYSDMPLYSPGVLFSSFMVFALFANAVLAVGGRNLSLNRSELIVVYIMLLIVASVSTMGLCEIILPAIAGMFYYASPENQWESLLLPYLPREILVTNELQIRNFFEGVASTDYPIPYEVWLIPMLLWGIFLLALYVTMVCIAVILRKQWMDHERLSYPLVQVPQLMIQGETSASLVNPFFKSGLMWAGAAIPIIVGLLSGLNRYYGGWPIVTTAWNIPIYGGQNLNLTVSFAILGFSYLIGGQVAFGVWGFALLAKFERMLFAFIGVSNKQLVWATSGGGQSELLNYQGLGALIVLVFMGLWVGRRHLRGVIDNFIGKPSELNDGDEIMSYRAAVLGLLVGVCVMTIWLWQLHTPLWASVLFVFLALIIFTGLTRIIAESGTAAIIPALTAPDFMVYGLGSKLLGAHGITTMSLMYVWGTDIRVFLMGVFANGLKLIEGMARESRRLVFWAILIAIFLGVIGSLYTVLHVSYRDGGINSSLWFFQGMPFRIYDTAIKGMQNEDVYWHGMGFVGLGGIAMYVLTWLRQRFLWWPLHPVGFPIMNAWIIDYVWFSVFLAWLFKQLILKYGGATLFVRSRNFFLGIIVGRVLVSGFWLVVDYFTGMVGNSIFWI